MNKEFWTHIIYGITIFTGCFVAFVKEISEKRPKLKWLGKLKFRIFIAGIITCTTILATCRINAINEHNKKIQDSTYEANQVHNQELSAFKIDSSNKESQKIIAAALGKYGFKFDSTSKELKKLILADSTKRVMVTNNNIMPGPEPELSLGTGGPPITLESSQGDTRTFIIRISDRSAEAYDANINFIGIKEDNNNVLSLISTQPIFGFRNRTFATGASLPIHFTATISNAKRIYFYFFGSYTNSGKTKRFPFDELCFYDFEFKTGSLPFAQQTLDVKNFLKKHKMIK